MNPGRLSNCLREKTTAILNPLTRINLGLEKGYRQDGFTRAGGLSNVNVLRRLTEEGRTRDSDLTWDNLQPGLV